MRTSTKTTDTTTPRASPTKTSPLRWLHECTFSWAEPAARSVLMALLVLMLVVLVMVMCVVEPNECTRYSVTEGCLSVSGSRFDIQADVVQPYGDTDNGPSWIAISKPRNDSIVHVNSNSSSRICDSSLEKCAVRDVAAVTFVLADVNDANGTATSSADTTVSSSSGAYSGVNANVLGQGRRAKVLSRNKRYVAFPEGSSFTVAFCATLGFVGNPSYIYFSWAINWGLGYELPNQTWILAQKGGRKRPLPQPVVQRRQRRELYGRLETAIESMGYNGRQCILRALCESTQYFASRGSNMVEELLRTIFSLPRSRVLSFEHDDLVQYDTAHRLGQQPPQPQQQRAFCPAAYPACGISLIEMALGEYSKSNYQ